MATYQRDPDALAVMLRGQTQFPRYGGDDAALSEMIPEETLYREQEEAGARGAASGGAYAIPSRESLRDSGIASLKQIFGVKQAEAEARALPSHISGQYRVEQEKVHQQGVSAATQAASHEKALDRESRERIAGKKGDGGWAEPTVDVQLPGQGGTVPVPRSLTRDPVKARGFLDAWEDAGLASKRGQADRTKIDAYRSFINELGQTYQAGQKANWNGVGPLEGPAKSTLYNWLGMGNKEEELFRTRLGQVQARSSFAEGGKQFTGTEQDLIDKFIAGANKSGPIAKMRLDESFLHGRNTLKSLGVPEALIDQYIKEALGGGDDASAIHSSDPSTWERVP